MNDWKIYLIKVATYLLTAPLLGYGLLVAIELVQKAWDSNNRRKKWIAMTIIASAYLALNGWFHY